MQEGFSPRQLFFNNLRFWWLPIGFALLGVFFGFLVSMLINPKFEAEAGIHVSVDFSKIGLVSDIEQDQFIEVIGDLCRSDLVIRRVSEQTDLVTPETFWIMASMERKNMQWVLKIRHENPSSAAEVAAIWQQVALQEIIEAHEHALVADSLSNYLRNLTGCLEGSVSQYPVYAGCTINSIKDLQALISQTVQVMQAEMVLSHGISPAISVSGLNEIKLPTRPISGDRSWLLFSGGGIGFILGIWFLLVGPTMMSQRNHSGINGRNDAGK